MEKSAEKMPLGGYCFVMLGWRDSSSEGHFSRDGKELDMRRWSGADFSHEAAWCLRNIQEVSLAVSQLGTGGRGAGDRGSG